MKRILAGTYTCLLLTLFGMGAEKNPEKKNVLALANGAVVISYSDQYSTGWSALNLIDGDANSGWSAQQSKGFPHEFVIELPQTNRLDSIALDDTGAQEDGYPGISAKTVEIWLSTTSAKDAFHKAMTTDIPKHGRKQVPMPTGSLAHWVKLVITSNYGNKDYTELMEAEAYGDPAGSAPAHPPITGSYDTNYGALYLTNQSGRINGCYPSSSGTVSGATDGRVINFEWRQGTRVGSSMMVLANDGTLNGYWYEGGRRQGMWYGHRTADKPGTCPQLADIGSSLEATGRAILYGIYFDADSDHLRADSEPTLQKLLAAMKHSPTMKLKVEGHTDSTNTDAYNMDLSRRRAQSVVAWLIKSGVAQERLAAEGLGKTRPVADNSTPQGRALNRRVEVSQIP